jgi:hypothetical protein
MAVGTPALVGGQHVVIGPEMSPHASAVLFVSLSHPYLEEHVQKVSSWCLYPAVDIAGNARDAQNKLPSQL